jgi:hypothetical protein
LDCFQPKPGYTDSHFQSSSWSGRTFWLRPPGRIGGTNNPVVLRSTFFKWPIISIKDRELTFYVKQQMAWSSARKTACLQLEGTLSSRIQNRKLRSQYDLFWNVALSESKKWHQHEHKYKFQKCSLKYEINLFIMFTLICNQSYDTLLNPTSWYQNNFNLVHKLITNLFSKLLIN